MDSLVAGTFDCSGNARAINSSAITPAEESLAIEYWTEVTKYIPEWQMAQAKKVSTAELRRDFIHAHGIALHTLGIVGHGLISADAKRWKERLRALEKVDWSRSNTKLWEGRAMVGGRVSKAHNNVILTSAALKKHLNLPLSPEEARVEKHFLKRGG